jgi:hypothetical protein
VRHSNSLLVVVIAAALFANCYPPLYADPLATSPSPQRPEEKFTVKNLVVTVKIPKDQPILTGDAELDKAIIKELPKLKCRIEFELDPVGGPLDQHATGITISADHGAHHLVFASGGDNVKKPKEGKYVVDAELFQNRPLNTASNATMALRVLRYKLGAEKPIEVDTKAGAIIFKYEDE